MKHGSVSGLFGVGLLTLENLSNSWIQEVLDEWFDKFSI